jgi:hypothetical protein
MIQNSTIQTNDSHRPEIFFKANDFGRQNSNFSRGSVTVGDYDSKITDTPTSCLMDFDYKLTRSLNKYKGLKELIVSWMNESSEFDIKEWPDIEKKLNENRLKFPNDT